ncbi:hypothetical protein CAAN1_02S08416 [[Candida] anglica]|uniref:glucan endo-1,3-beta-D-glucosidase n=1 Tax=[Candida] anglica TaxID=148631 RepID=A0ABP0ECF5_9ASCO
MNEIDTKDKRSEPGKLDTPISGSWAGSSPSINLNPISKVNRMKSDSKSLVEINKLNSNESDFPEPKRSKSFSSIFWGDRMKNKTHPRVVSLYNSSRDNSFQLEPRNSKRVGLSLKECGYFENELIRCQDSSGTAENLKEQSVDKILQPNSLQRFSTVKYTKFEKKQAKEYLESKPIDLAGDFKIDAISPLSQETTEDAASITSQTNPVGQNIENTLKLKSPLLKKRSNSLLRSSIHEAQNSIYSFEKGRDDSALFTSEILPPKIENKKKLKKKKNWLVWLFGLVIVALIGGFVPAVVILSFGTESAIMKFMNKMDDENRLEFLNRLSSLYGNYSTIQTVQYNTTKDYSSPNEGANLRGYNGIEGIPVEYWSDDELISLMSNDKFVGTIFYGVAYSPRGALIPCNTSPREIMLDIAVLSKVTTRVKTYAMQCQQNEYILRAIQNLNLNMTLSMGVWIGNNEEVNRQQMNAFKSILKLFPRKMFESVYIGNEVLFRNEQSRSSLLNLIREAKEYATSIGYGDLSIGTTEIGSLIDDSLMETCDVIGANIHPFFGGGDVSKATNWVFDYLKFQIEPIGHPNTNARVEITEVGWPYKGGSYQSAIASASNEQWFMNAFVCEAYNNNYGWYFFEAFDEPWKSIFYEGSNKWETEWGIFTNDRKFKDGITFPNCGNNI